MSTRTDDPVLAKIRAGIGAHSDAQRAMTHAVAVLKESIAAYTWVGIYLLEGDELVLRSFLGKPSPHTRIPLGRGICGAAATQKATIIVDDVNADPRYLACSIETKSEIVVPIMQEGRVLGEIDIDSDRPAAFREADRELLESVAELLAPRIATPR
jgi:GAF domain-containing protein